MNTIMNTNRKIDIILENLTKAECNINNIANLLSAVAAGTPEIIFEDPEVVKATLNVITGALIMCQDDISFIKKKTEELKEGIND